MERPNVAKRVAVRAWGVGAEHLHLELSEVGNLYAPFRSSPLVEGVQALPGCQLANHPHPVCRYRWVNGCHAEYSVNPFKELIR